MGRATTLLVWAVGLAASTTACDFYEPPPEVFGRATYQCASSEDPVCDGMSPTVVATPVGGVLLPPIAVGATFSLVGAAESLSPARVVGTTILKGIVPGIAAVTNRATIEHVELRAPATIRVAHEATAFDNAFSETTFTLRSPQDRLRATLVDANGFILAGAAEATWSSDNEKVLTIFDSGHIITLDLHAVGTANLTVEMAGVSLVIPIAHGAP